MLALPRLLLAASLVAPAAAQTDVLYEIERPAGTPSDWGTRLFALPDLDGDGVGELGLGTRTHGGGTVAWVHSGASGALLVPLAVPPALLFYGQSVVPAGDHDGDGVVDFVLVGTKSGASGSPDGRFIVLSGADGSLVRELAPPPGIVLVEAPAVAFPDQDGDGLPDVLCRAVPVAASGSPHVQLFSSATGAALYSGIAEPPSSSIGNRIVVLEDRDGDGVPDFATTGSDGEGSRVDLRSGRTGEVLQVLRGRGIGVLTGNGEPLVRTPDRDGDGLDDLAVGSFFELDGAGGFGLVRHFSSADAGELRVWSGSRVSELLGFLMVAPGDLDLDGEADLLAVEQQRDAQGTLLGAAFVGLSLGRAEPIFTELVPALGGLHLSALVALPGVDPEGFASFATYEGADQTVRVRRYAPAAGTAYCASTPTSAGIAATMRILGSARIAQAKLLLEARDAIPAQFGLFFYGSEAVQRPFGQGFLCVAGGASGIARLPLEISDAAGRFTHDLDYGAPPTPATEITPGSTWHFQCWFRDPALAPGFQTSDAVGVVFEP